MSKKRASNELLQVVLARVLRFPPPPPKKLYLYQEARRSAVAAAIFAAASRAEAHALGIHRVCAPQARWTLLGGEAQVHAVACTDPAQSGACSCAPGAEGHSWGAADVGCLPHSGSSSGSQYVRPTRGICGRPTANYIRRQGPNHHRGPLLRELSPQRVAPSTARSPSNSAGAPPPPPP